MKTVTSHPASFPPWNVKTAILAIVVFAMLDIRPILGQTVEIPDPGLRAAIRFALEDPTGDITVEEMESLTELDASVFVREGAIRSLQGLETAVNLQSLNLEGIDFADGGIPFILIDDFSPLADLPHLTTLDLSLNFLTSLTLPEGFENLTTLDLGGNRLRDFSFLEGLSSLTELDLSYNELTSPTLPEGLDNLTTLNLRGNELTSLTLPEGLGNLTTLNLRGNQLSDFSFLEGLSSLTVLNLSGNDLTSLTLPEGLDSLTTLDLEGNQLSDFSFLEGLVSLTTLDLENNDLSSLILVERLNNLKELNLYQNKLTDFAFLEKTPNLELLDIGENDLTEIPDIHRLTHLSSLYIDGNPISDFSVLTDLPNLATLWLGRHGHANYSFLEGMAGLNTLVFYQQSNDLILPAGLTGLTTLDLSSSSISYLAVPLSMDLENIELWGFEKSDVTFYIPLHVARMEDRIEITWPEGVLQSKDTIGGLWSDVEGATSPHSVDVFEPQQFFRVRSE